MFHPAYALVRPFLLLQLVHFLYIYNAFPLKFIVNSQEYNRIQKEELISKSIFQELLLDFCVRAIVLCLYENYNVKAENADLFLIFLMLIRYTHNCYNLIPGYKILKYIIAAYLSMNLIMLRDFNLALAIELPIYYSTMIMYRMLVKERVILEE